MTQMRVQPARWLLAACVLLAAANLRPAITALGPLVEAIGAEQQLAPAMFGFLGALPLLVFALVSPLVGSMQVRFGATRVMTVAMFVLAIGTLLRSLPGFTGWVWVGTAILAAAIAVGNVLLPVVVRHDFPEHVSLMTGLYSAVMVAFAALGSGIAVPLADVSSWRFSLGIWAVLALIALVCWTFRGTSRSPATAEPPSVQAEVAPAAARISIWKSPIAWWVSLFMAFQSLSFYFIITWMPSLELSRGTSASAAGWHMFFFQIIGIFTGLITGRIMVRRRSHPWVAVVTSGLLVTAYGALIWWPELTMWWIFVAGISAGSTIVVALTFIATRTVTTADAGRLSGMAQGVGYLIAAAGPLGAGVLIEHFDWEVVLGAAMVAGIGQTVVGYLAGRDRVIGHA